MPFVYGSHKVSTHRVALGVGVAVAGLLSLAWTPSTLAFQHLHTKAGATMHWAQPTITYRLVYDAAPPEPAASQQSDPLATRLAGMMAPWLQVKCPRGGAEVPVGLAMQQSAAPEVVSCPNDSDGMRRCLGGDGVVRVVAKESDWPLSTLTVGYTLLAADAGSGVIQRFGLVLNDATYDFCDLNCDGKAFDIGTVVVHEAGHLLGLDHTAVETAVMAAGRSAAEILRQLHADDRAGLCAIYPVERDDGGGGCQAARGGAGGGGPWVALAFALLALAAARRRRQRARGGEVTALATWTVVAASTLAQPNSVAAYTLATVPSGAHQRWYTSELVWDLDETGLRTQGLDDASVAQVAAAAIATWLQVSCTLCHDPRGVACAPMTCGAHAIGLTARFDGWRPPRPFGLGCLDLPAGVACEGKPDGNQVRFVAEAATWPTSSHVIGLTLVAADGKTGAIGDADILLNAVDKTFCVAPACAGAAYDLGNTLTHEFGHLLGLDHSSQPAATMYGGAPPGETAKRDLEDDDRLGACQAYRRAYAAGGCPPEPEPEGCGAQGHAGASAATCSLLGIALFALWAVRGEDPARNDS